MGKLTLEEAIVHAKEVAEKNYRGADFESIDSIDDAIKTNCIKCAEEHMQLAEWLEELKSYKDLEEQGLLVRLPVKIETELFQPCADRKSIIRSIVINNTITDDDIYIGIIDERGNERHYSKKSIGKTVFLTREEAVKKLEEMKNDKA